jgi:hypothetical protein
MDPVIRLVLRIRHKGRHPKKKRIATAIDIFVKIRKAEDSSVAGAKFYSN